MEVEALDPLGFPTIIVAAVDSGTQLGEDVLRDAANTRMAELNLKIVSGGQTGSDRGALDWAIAHGFPYGGWCPAGRRAEDGLIPVTYLLTETPSRAYVQRTRWNVRDSDGTLIVSLRPVLTGGSKKTLDFARELGRPSLHMHPGNALPRAIRRFIEEHDIRVLNVAGPRESKEAGIGNYVREVLCAAELVEARTD